MMQSSERDEDGGFDRVLVLFFATLVSGVSALAVAETLLM